MISTASEFALQLAGARRAFGLTQRDFALAIRVGERFIVDLEGSKPTAQLDKALAGTKAAGMRIVDLSSETSEQTP